MPVRCLILFVLLGFWACEPKAPVGASSLTLPSERNHLDAMAGVSLDVPDTWSEQDEPAVLILHGPAGTDAFYATLAIQRRVALNEQRLDEAVALALAAMSHEAGFMWDNLTVEAIGQDLALGYGVRFNALEVSHRQRGLVFVHDGVLVAITLSAPSELFESVIPVFQRAIDTLSVLPKTWAPEHAHTAPLDTPHPTRSPL